MLLPFGVMFTSLGPKVSGTSLPQADSQWVHSRLAVTPVCSKFNDDFLLSLGIAVGLLLSFLTPVYFLLFDAQLKYAGCTG